MKNIEIFTDNNLKRSIFKLALPAVLASLTSIVYLMVDMIFIGKMNDYLKIAAVSMASPFFFSFMAIGITFGTGGASLISRMLAVQKKNVIKKTSCICFYLPLFISIIYPVILYFFLPKILFFMGCEDNQLFIYAKQYTNILLIFSPFIILETVLQNLLRSEGATKENFYALLLGNAANTILDPILIFTFNLELIGAALATILGYVFAFSYMLFYILKKKTNLSIDIKYFSLNRTIIKYVLFIGLSSALGLCIVILSDFVLNKYVVLYGAIYLASSGIAFRIFSIIPTVTLAFSLGIQPLIGFNFQKRNFDKMFKIIKYGIFINIIFSIFYIINIIMFSENIISIFSKNLEVIHNTKEFLKTLSFCALFIGITFILMQFFQAIGKGLYSLSVLIIRGTIIVISTILMNHYFKLNGIIYSKLFAEIIVCITTIFLFVKCKKHLHDKNL